MAGIKNPMINYVIAAGLYWGLVYVLYGPNKQEPLVLMDVDR